MEYSSWFCVRSEWVSVFTKNNFEKQKVHPLRGGLLHIFEEKYRAFCPEIGILIGTFVLLNNLCSAICIFYRQIAEGRRQSESLCQFV